MHFADELIGRVRELGHPLCVGLDPHLDRIPESFRKGSMRPRRPGSLLDRIPVIGRGNFAASIAYLPLVEDTSLRPEIGTRIKLYVNLKPPRAFEAETPFELTGAISRHSSDGFAVKFEDSLDPDLRRMVDDAAAIVATRC